VGECRTGVPAHFDYYRPGGGGGGGGSAFGAAAAPSPRPVLSAPDREGLDDAAAAVGDAVAELAEDWTTSCVVEGDINTTETWHVIGNATRTTTASRPHDAAGLAETGTETAEGLAETAGFKFDFTFPQSVTLLNMGIYGEAEQLRLREDDDSCWHKHSVIPSHRVHDRVRTMQHRAACHWHRQKWGTGARASLDSQQFILCCFTLDLYKICIAQLLKLVHFFHFY